MRARLRVCSKGNQNIENQRITKRVYRSSLRGRRLNFLILFFVAKIYVEEEHSNPLHFRPKSSLS